MVEEDDTQAYLARIRKTVAESKALLESLDLRMAETDRLLARAGLTREELMAMEFTPEQKALVNEELKRRGLPPVEDEEEAAAAAGGAADAGEAPQSASEALGARRSKLAALAARFRRI